MDPSTLATFMIFQRWCAVNLHLLIGQSVPKNMKGLKKVNGVSYTSHSVKMTLAQKLFKVHGPSMLQPSDVNLFVLIRKAEEESVFMLAILSHTGTNYKKRYFKTYLTNCQLELKGRIETLFYWKQSRPACFVSEVLPDFKLVDDDSVGLWKPENCQAIFLNQICGKIVCSPPSFYQ